jgi:hypothetical protein
MSGPDRAGEYLHALRATRTDDLLPLMEAGVSVQIIDAMALAISRITVEGSTYQPDPCGGIAFCSRYGPTIR